MFVNPNSILRLMPYYLFCAGLLSFTIVHAGTNLTITVDDLPAHGTLSPNISRVDIANKMIAALQKHHVPKVYGFINAKRMEDDPSTFEVLKLWRTAGYPIGNHTYSHASLDDISVSDYKTEISANESVLRDLMKDQDWKYFRFPYLKEGNTLAKRNGVRSFLKDNGYKTAQVSVDFVDWSWNEPYARCVSLADDHAIDWLKKTYLQNAKDQLENEVELSNKLFHRPVPQILLMHIGAFDAEMMDRLLTQFEQSGVKFIPLSEALRDPIYSQDPGMSTPRGAQFPQQIMNARHLTLKDLKLSERGSYPGTELEQICSNASASSDLKSQGKHPRKPASKSDAIKP